MSYVKTTIWKTMLAIKNGEMYLPAIQRKYVWSESRIIKLMDSIMRGYPIGTCLYWRVSGQTINDKKYSLYCFIHEYHQRDRYENERAPWPFDQNKVVSAVLDGQQRLTSLYISLQGTLQMKLPKKRWENDDAFPKKELYLNIAKPPIENEEDMQYEFAFLTESDARSKDEQTLWYKVKNIVQFDSKTILTDLIVPNGWAGNPIIINNLVTLNNSLVNEEAINYYEVTSEKIDDVLDVFVRINSGGVVLSKTDLLFSTVVSHWDNAREEIEQLLKSINKVGQRFQFTNDFIMRTSLYVLGHSVNLKVEFFTRNNVLGIKENWADISKSIKKTVELLNIFGFCDENITSYVAIMPIVYFLYHSSGEYSETDKENIKKYYVFSQLKRVFGAGSNSVLESIRKGLNDTRNSQTNSGKYSFDLNKLSELKLPNSSLKFTQEDIDSLFDEEKGPYTFMILSLLYPDLKFDQKTFHQDHMHPYSSFTDRNLRSIKLPGNVVWDKERIGIWQQRRNSLANLQLLEGRENESKNDTTLNDWLGKDNNRAAVKYLPQDISYELDNFEQFMEKRKELMEAELKKLLLGNDGARMREEY